MEFRHKYLAFLMARLGLGINFLFHGLVRMPKLSQFANGLASGFEGTFIPMEIARLYGYAIPFIELLIGLALVLGIFTRKALFLGGLFMSTLIMGKALQEDWGTLGTQMIYLIVFYLLLRDAEWNSGELIKG